MNISMPSSRPARPRSFLDISPTASGLPPTRSRFRKFLIGFLLLYINITGLEIA